MKRLFLATIGVAALATGTASAADMPMPYKAPPVAAARCAGQQWQGAHVGIHGGGVNYTANRTDLDAFLNTEATFVQKAWGGEVGGQLGYNWAN